MLTLLPGPRHFPLRIPRHLHHGHFWKTRFATHYLPTNGLVSASRRTLLSSSRRKLSESATDRLLRLPFRCVLRTRSVIKYHPRKKAATLTSTTGIGPIPSIYFSEAFPLSHREIGAAFTICVNNSVSSALGLTFPALLAKVTPVGAFCLYAGLNMLSFVVIFFVVPETQRRTLEELDVVFGVPTKKHAAWQVGVWLPWWFKRCVLRRREVKLARELI